MDEEIRLHKKSKLREEIEILLKEKGLAFEPKITVLNLENDEAYYFDDYPQAMEFLKGKKGRWYLATPGLSKQKRNAGNGHI